MVRVLGVDGCKAGWIGVDYDTSCRAPASWRVYSDFRSVLDRLGEVKSICVDIPIGFLSGMPGEVTKPAEVEVRRFIGPRRSSVFASPMRSSLEFYTHDTAKLHNKLKSGRSLQIQAFCLFPKLREVDQCLSPKLQSHVFEVHPEASFTAIAGHPANFPKKVVEGELERINLLERFGLGAHFIDSLSVPKRVASRDDLIDASLAAVTAGRIVAGEARRFPQDDVFDERGLRMAIFA